MAVIGIRDLSRKTRDVLDQLQENGEPVIVARHGKPVAILSVPTPQQLDDAELAATPGFREGLDQANRELADGESESFEQFVAEVEAASEEGIVVTGSDATRRAYGIGPGRALGITLDSDLVNQMVEEKVDEAVAAALRGIQQKRAQAPRKAVVRGFQFEAPDEIS